MYLPMKAHGMLVITLIKLFAGISALLLRRHRDLYLRVCEYPLH